MANRTMEGLYTVRRDNLRKLAAIFGQNDLAKRCGVGKSYMSQVIGKNAALRITETTARAWEREMGIEAFSLDGDYEWEAK